MYTKGKYVGSSQNALGEEATLEEATTQGRVCVEYYDFDCYGWDDPVADERLEFTPYDELMQTAVWLEHDTATRVLDGQSRDLAVQDEIRSPLLNSQTQQQDDQRQIVKRHHTRK